MHHHNNTATDIRNSGYIHLELNIESFEVENDIQSLFDISIPREYWLCGTFMAHQLILANYMTLDLFRL
jgi:hypothetical protein